MKYLHPTMLRFNTVYQKQKAEQMLKIAKQQEAEKKKQLNNK